MDEAEDAILEYREVFFKDKFLNTPIYSRDRLPFQFKIKGPAIRIQCLLGHLSNLRC